MRSRGLLSLNLGSSEWMPDKTGANEGCCLGGILPLSSTGLWLALALASLVALGQLGCLGQGQHCPQNFSPPLPLG